MSNGQSDTDFAQGFYRYGGRATQDTQNSSGPWLQNTNVNWLSNNPRYMETPSRETGHVAIKWMKE